MENQHTAPLTDAVIVAVSQLVDDSQTERRDPSHYDLESLIERHGLISGDPKSQGQTVGKTKRIRATLNWAYSNNEEAGGRLVYGIISLIRGHGGFRGTSPNFVGRDAIRNCIDVFDAEGFELSEDGQLRPKVLDSLSGAALTDALKAYVRRATRGAEDAALLTGTGKDLLEAIAAHIVQQKFGSYSTQSNFPTLLGQAYAALGIVTPHDQPQAGEGPEKRVERAMFELACSVNSLRNKQGTGHGRPWLSTVSDSQARMAVESMGVIGERLLDILGGSK
ncbi:abortive infection family protein [Halomonas salifodinae]|uniref:Abortive infection family protein n=1 Tax=Halomonas salifodinae TaxID=438745 RepID=A0ABW2F4J8_9GAMM